MLNQSGQTNTLNKQVLEGVKILDMATFLAAPFAATLCADLGAEVVKLELPTGQDPLRMLAPVKGEHAIHAKVSNRGKKGITLDVRKPEGRDIFLKLLPQFDVLVENFRTGTLDSWGLSLQELHKANPHLIILRLTGFGQTGPYARRPGFARIFEAMSGFAHLMGEPDGSPQHMNYALGDMIAGVFGAFAITSALTEQARNPNLSGREIDLSAAEALLRLLETLPAEYEELGVIRKRSGARATYTAPSNIYQTADGAWVTIVASSDAIFGRLCAAMQQNELLNEPEFATLQDRIAHVDKIDAIVANWCKQKSFKELNAALSKHSVPFNRVNSIEEVMQEPQFKARNAIIHMEDPALGHLAAPCVVPRYSNTQPPIPRTGPNLGEHNDEVYQTIGLDKVALKRLKQKNII